jgi:hypothetical protein
LGEVRVIFSAVWNSWDLGFDLVGISSIFCVSNACVSIISQHIPLSILLYSPVHYTTKKIKRKTNIMIKPQLFNHRFRGSKWWIANNLLTVTNHLHATEYYRLWWYRLVSMWHFKLRLKCRITGYFRDNPISTIFASIF